MSAGNIHTSSTAPNSEKITRKQAVEINRAAQIDYLSTKAYLSDAEQLKSFSDQQIDDLCATVQQHEQDYLKRSSGPTYIKQRLANTISGIVAFIVQGNQRAIPNVVQKHSLRTIATSTTPACTPAPNLFQEQRHRSED